MDKDKRGEKYATTKEEGRIFFRKNSNDVHLQNSEENGSSGKLFGVRNVCLFLKGRNGDQSPLPSCIYRE